MYSLRTEQINLLKENKEEFEDIYDHELLFGGVSLGKKEFSDGETIELKISRKDKFSDTHISIKLSSLEGKEIHFYTLKSAIMFYKEYRL